MTSKSKRIGTSCGETPFVNWAKENGFPHARRLALSGNTDEGDVLLDPVAKLIVEVKAGGVAERSEPAWLADAMKQLDAEMRNFGAAAGFLVTKRKGYGEKRVSDWWAWCWASVRSTGERTYIIPFEFEDNAVIPIRMTVSDAIKFLRMDGYGDPL